MQHLQNYKLSPLCSSLASEQILPEKTTFSFFIYSLYGTSVISLLNVNSNHLQKNKEQTKIFYDLIY